MKLDHLSGAGQGWNLWVGGPPNQPKDGISALSGVVETDWSPFTFTMNWRFTRAHHRVRFEAGEAIAFLFPVERAAIESFEPRFAPLDSAPDLEAAFHDWSLSRNAFHKAMALDPPAKPSDKWQKHYFRGVDSSGHSQIQDHRTKLHVRPFAPDASGWTGAPSHSNSGCPVAAKGAEPIAGRPDRAEPSSEIERLRWDLRKRDWLLDTLEAQRAVSHATCAIERRSNVSAQEFLERYYAVNRPVVLTGEMTNWTALNRWSPQYLEEQLGDLPVEYQADRASDPAFEERMDAHRRNGPFREFLDLATSGLRNDVYMTAYNAAANGEVVARLSQDLGTLDRFLRHENGPGSGMLWIGPEGTFTPLHHDLTNNFIAQIVGRKTLRLAPPSETAKLHNAHHVYSAIRDVEATVDINAFPRFENVRLYDIELSPGEVLFVPVGWWHQVRALSFSITATYTDFIWPNNAAETYPYRQ